MKITVSELAKMKQKGEKIVAITAYDCLMAEIFDKSAQLLLIGDSLNMVVKGEEDTLSATVNEIIYHTKAVKKGAKNAFILADMPFGSYHDIKNAKKSALKIIKESGADAVKIELDESKIPILKALCDEGIAVMAHIGLKPQFVRFEGGYKIAGKNEEGAKKLANCALKMQEAGAFALLLEGIKASTAENITKSVSIPTIGIGSGPACDGQILVYSDAFGIFDKFKPKFVRRYLQGKSLFEEAMNKYAQDVKKGVFPNESESY